MAPNEDLVGCGHVPQSLDWRRAHEALTKLAKTRSALDRDEGRWLLHGLRAAVHAHVGYGSFSEYVERLFGYSPRWTNEKLRVAEALEQLPELDQALHDAVISWSAAREIVRVATPEKESAWLEAARGRTVREIEQFVAGRKMGDGPDVAPDNRLRRHVLRFEVTGDVLATFREAVAKLRRNSDERLDDEMALLAMARQILGGPTDSGRAAIKSD